MEVTLGHHSTKIKTTPSRSTKVSWRSTKNKMEGQGGRAKTFLCLATMLILVVCTHGNPKPNFGHVVPPPPRDQRMLDFPPRGQRRPWGSGVNLVIDERKNDAPDSEYKKSKENLDKQLAKLTMDQMTFDEHLNNKTGDIDKAAKLQSGREMDLAQKMNSYTKLEGKFHNFQIQIQDRGDTIRKLQNEKAHLQLQLNDLMTQLVHIESKYESFDGQLKEKQIQIEKIEDSAKSLNDQFGKLSQDLLSLEGELSSLTDRLQTKLKKIVELRNRQDKIEQKFREKFHILNRLKEKLRFLQTQITTHSGETSQLEKFLQILETKLNKKFDLLEDVVTKTQGLMTDFAAKSDQISKVEMELKKLGERLVDISKNLDTTQKAQNEGEGNLINLDKRLGQLEGVKSGLFNIVKKIQDQPVPDGSIYVQLPQMDEPSYLWPHCKEEWIEITGNFAGAFFRAEGGYSAPFGEWQEASAPKIVQAEYGWSGQIGKVPDPAKFNCNDWSSEISVGMGLHSNPQGVADWIKFRTNGCQVRPDNLAIKIWQRRSKNYVTSHGGPGPGVIGIVRPVVAIKVPYFGFGEDNNFGSHGGHRFKRNGTI